MQKWHLQHPCPTPPAKSYTVKHPHSGLKRDIEGIYQSVRAVLEVLKHFAEFANLGVSQTTIFKHVDPLKPHKDRSM